MLSASSLGVQGGTERANDKAGESPLRNTIRCTNVGLMLARRLRRRPSIEPTLGDFSSSVLGGLSLEY